MVKFLKKLGMQLLFIFLLLTLVQMSQNVYQQNYHFSTSIFEQDVQSQQPLQKSYVLNDEKENEISKMARSASEMTIEVIRYLVYMVGDLITLLIN